MMSLAIFVHYWLPCSPSSLPFLKRSSVVHSPVLFLPPALGRRRTPCWQSTMAMPPGSRNCRWGCDWLSQPSGDKIYCWEVRQRKQWKWDDDKSKNRNEENQVRVAMARTVIFIRTFLHRARERKLSSTITEFYGTGSICSLYEYSVCILASSLRARSMHTTSRVVPELLLTQWLIQKINKNLSCCF